MSCPPDRLTFSVAEVAALLGVSPKTVRRMVHSGALRCVYVRSLPMIPADELHKLVGAHDGR